MKLLGLPTGVTDWSSLDASSQPGATGAAIIRGHQAGDMQLRLVDYSAGYTADHWCHKGHVVFVISGALTIAHEDGRRYELKSGMAYHVPDNEDSPHRVTSREGASVFILD
jgi:quercetin dioxygenase-like cupin family protein